MLIGLDVGGSNIDIVAIENQKIIDYRKFEIGSDLISSLLSILEDFLILKSHKEINGIVLSTTITTNAIVQNELNNVGMIIESSIGAKPDFLFCGNCNILLNGYINNRGFEVKTFNKYLINQAIQKFKNENINTVGIVTKFSVRNPSHELEIFNAIKPYQFDFITLGHKISGKLNFPRRVYSTYLNCAVYSRFNEFFNAISKLIYECKIGLENVYIQKPDGGIVNFKDIKDFPIMSILSGPAASAQGAYVLTRPDYDAVTVDIGGTTTDISFIENGQFILEHYGAKIGKYPTLVRAIFSRSIALGGDSIIKTHNNVIQVGPEIIRPYHLNDHCITLTDILKYLSNAIDHSLKIKLNNFSKKYNISIDKLCNLAISIAVTMIKDEIYKCINYINNTPIYTINRLIYEKRLSPKKVILVGGPALLLKPFLQRDLNMEVVVPKYYSIANAIGCAMASITKEYNFIVDTFKGILTIPELGIFDNFIDDINLNQAKNLLTKKIVEHENYININDIEIIEENSFNIIRNYRYCGKIIKLKAQLKPKIENLLL